MGSVITTLLTNNSIGVNRLLRIILSGLRVGAAAITGNIRVAVSLGNGVLIIRLLGATTASTRAGAVGMSLGRVVTRLGRLNVGNNGNCRDTVVPLLRTLVYSGIGSPSRCLDSCGGTGSGLLVGVLGPLFNFMGGITSGPFSALATILPGLTCFVSGGNVNGILSGLLSPIASVVGILSGGNMDISGVVRTVTNGSLPSLVNNLVNTGLDNLSLEVNGLTGYGVRSCLTSVVGTILGDGGLGVGVNGVSFNFLTDLNSLGAICNTTNSVGRVATGRNRMLIALLHCVRDILVGGTSSVGGLLNGVSTVGGGTAVGNVLSDMFTGVTATGGSSVILTVFCLLLTRPASAFFSCSGFRRGSCSFRCPSAISISFLAIVNPVLSNLMNNLIPNKLSDLMATGICGSGVVDSLTANLCNTIRGIGINGVDLASLLTRANVSFSASGITSLLASGACNRDFRTTTGAVGDTNS